MLRIYPNWRFIVSQNHRVNVFKKTWISKINHSPWNYKLFTIASVLLIELGQIEPPQLQLGIYFFFNEKVKKKKKLEVGNMLVPSEHSVRVMQKLVDAKRLSTLVPRDNAENRGAIDFISKSPIAVKTYSPIKFFFFFKKRKFRVEMMINYCPENFKVSSTILL